MHYFTTIFTIMTVFFFLFEGTNYAEKTNVTSANPPPFPKMQITCCITMCCRVKYRFSRNPKQRDYLSQYIKN